MRQIDKNGNFVSGKWYKELEKDMFGFDSLEPSKKEKDASVWRKRNKDKSQNSMLRGKALLDYRRSIVEEQEENQ